MRTPHLGRSRKILSTYFSLNIYAIFYSYSNGMRHWSIGMGLVPGGVLLMYLRYWLSTSSSTGRLSGPNRWPRRVRCIFTQISLFPLALTPSSIEQRRASLQGGGGGRKRGGGRQDGGGSEKESGRERRGGKRGRGKGEEERGRRGKKEDNCSLHKTQN